MNHKNRNEFQATIVHSILIVQFINELVSFSYFSSFSLTVFLFFFSSFSDVIMFAHAKIKVRSLNTLFYRVRNHINFNFICDKLKLFCLLRFNKAFLQFQFLWLPYVDWMWRMRKNLVWYRHCFQFTRMALDKICRIVSHSGR